MKSVHWRPMKTPGEAKRRRQECGEGPFDETGSGGAQHLPARRPPGAQGRRSSRRTSAPARPRQARHHHRGLARTLLPTNFWVKFREDRRFRTSPGPRKAPEEHSKTLTRSFDSIQDSLSTPKSRKGRIQTHSASRGSSTSAASSALSSEKRIADRIQAPKPSPRATKRLK